MGLSLETIESGVMNVGNVLLKGVQKFNEIRKEAVGVTPATSTAPINNANAATAGTVQEKLQTSGTLDQQIAKAKGGNGLFLVVGLILLMMAFRKKG
jgi:hypothetical protein